MVGKYWVLTGCLVAVVFFVAGRALAVDQVPGVKPGKPVVTLPEPASKALKEAFPKATLGEVGMHERMGIPIYRVDLRGEGGSQMWAFVAGDGTIQMIRTRIELKDVPEAPAATIKKAVEGGELKGVYRHETRAEFRKVKGAERLVKLEKPVISYEATVLKEGKESHVKVAESGTLWEGHKEVYSAPKTPQTE